MRVLLEERIGEIKATILERDGKSMMVKDCTSHGHFEDVIAIDSAFFKHIEEVFPVVTFNLTVTGGCTTMAVAHPIWLRSGAHDRSNKPLQHDV